MRIVGLDIANVKRISAVSILDPNDDVQIIGGRNAQGKTSVLDAIWLALGGAKASKATPSPVHDGAKSAKVTVRLGDDQPEMIVERTWGKTGRSQLRVTSADGRRYDSPQRMLDDLVGNLAYNPVAFLSESPKDQRDTLLRLIGVGDQIDQLDVERKRLFDERTSVNRSVRDSEGQISRIEAEGVGSNDTLKARSMPEVMADLDRVQKAQRDWDRVNDELTQLTTKVAQLRSQLAMAEQSVNEYTTWLAQNARPDDSALRQELSNAERAGAVQARLNLLKDAQRLLNDRKSRAESLTAAITKIDDQKTELLTSAHMPIDGLGFDENGVLYNGQPLQQCSGAEGLKVSLALATAQGSDIRVILIRDGSLLDDDSMAEVAAFAKEHDVQVWIERVGDGDDDAIIIEDGELK